MACNFNFPYEDIGLLKVIGSHILRNCDSVSETVQDGVSITTDH